MRILLDTNILLRLSEASHPHHAPAVDSVRRLAASGHTFCIGSQTVSEFLAVATRPIADRGLGMNQAIADAELSKLTSALEVLFDSPAVLAELRRLVVTRAVTGKSVHDTKLVAAMICGAVTTILTFNTGDFTRFAPTVNVVDPANVAIQGLPSSS